MKTSRREFLRTTGYVAIGFSLLPNIAWLAGEDCDNLPAPETKLNDWLQVLENGRVKVFTGKMELGQGIRIAIAQVAAEELSTGVDLVEVHTAETGVTPNEGYTAGSNSIAKSAMAVRKAAAAAAAIFIDKASEKYQVDRNELTIKNGKILSNDGKFSVTFFDVLDGEQIEQEIPNTVRPKPKNEHRIVGTPVLRKDIAKMVRGEAVYVQDLRFPDMVHARILRPLSYTAQLISCNTENAEKLEDVLKVVRINNFIGVIAKEEFQAEKAERILRIDCEWELREKLPENQFSKDYLKSLTSQTEKVEEEGAVEFRGNSIKAAYYKPYLMHAATGPSCAVAYYDGENMQVWTHSQGVYPLRAALSNLLKLSEEKVRVTGVPGSGCYGHNGADDVAAEAAILAREYPNQHIRLQWTRQEEHAWEPFGSAMIMELEGSVDSAGKINNWKYDLWSDTHSTRPGGRKENLLPTPYYEGTTKIGLEGYLGGGYRNSRPYYEIPNKRIDAHFFHGPLRVSALRSLGAYANIFAIESFMDELAEEAGKDPVEFRLAHLNDSRAIDVVRRVKVMTDNLTIAEKEGIGFAFSRYKNSASYFAVAVKVGLNEDGEISVKNMWGAIDSGEVVNPDGLKNQTEGGMIQSASWTMFEEVIFNETHVTSTDWRSYPVFRFKEIPDVQVEIIDRPDEDALGAGEAAQGPTAAAIVNAIYRATGKRVRDLPVNKHFS